MPDNQPLQGVTISASGLDDLLYRMNKEQSQKFINRVMWKLANQGKSAAVKKIRELYNIRPADIKIFVNHATHGPYEREIVGRGNPIPYDHFKYQKSGIGVLVKRRKDRTDVLMTSFIQKMPNGKIGIFKVKSPKEREKKNPKKFQLQKVFGPSTADILDGKTLRTHINEIVAENSEKVIGQEFNFMMNIEGK